MLADWGDIDRSFPSYVANPGDRELYVVPFVQRGLQASEFTNDWQTFTMILERRPEDIDGVTLPYEPAITVPYPPFYPGFAGLSAEARNAIVCANPYDSFDYFPKVFRIPAVDATLNEGGTDNPEGLQDNQILLLVPNNTADLGLLVRPGDMLLGDNGTIYRVVGYPDLAGNPSLLIVSEEGRQANQGVLTADRSLRSVWFAIRPTRDAKSPLRDIRLLSQDAVRIVE